jgi:hypothetical protein
MHKTIGRLITGAGYHQECKLTCFVGSWPILVKPREWQPRQGARRNFPSGIALSSRPICVQIDVMQSPNDPGPPEWSPELSARGLRQAVHVGGRGRQSRRRQKWSQTHLAFEGTHCHEEKRHERRERSFGDSGNGLRVEGHNRPPRHRAE